MDQRVALSLSRMAFGSASSYFLSSLCVYLKIGLSIFQAANHSICVGFIH